MGSTNEVSVELALAKDLGYLGKETCDALQTECDEIGKGIHKLIQVLALVCFQSPTSDFEPLDLVGEHSVVSDGRPRGLLNATEETLPA